MSLVSTPAVVLSTLKYSESSKIVRLATRDFGVQSAIAKGARRPRSRFGAALQVLSEGQAQLYVRDHRELHTLAAFDLTRVPVRLAEALERYAAASVLAELMARFAPADAHPESFEMLRAGLAALESAEGGAVRPLGIRVVWEMVSVLGFAPALDACVRDGAAVPAGALAFSPPEGGALCAACAGPAGGIRLPADARDDLTQLLDGMAPLPELDARNAAAHERLLGRYVRWHLAEGAELPALEFWTRRPWRRG
jgi:DNA repair protein RecO (recombination protein O)